MESLQVLIVSDGAIVDVQEFDDPRVRFVEDFNRLNHSTQFTAVLQPMIVAEAEPVRCGNRCQPRCRCRVVSR